MLRIIGWTCFSIVALVALVLVMPSLVQSARFGIAQYRGATLAVYLDSGHIFYGNVRSFGFSTLVLTNTHTFQSVTVGETETNSIQAQRANALTAPKDWVAINRKHILFIEEAGRAAKILPILEGT